jgi:ATP-binding cassette, subfamily B, bacterial HlyB/CyaB
METGLASIEVVSKIHSVSIDVQAVKRRYFVEKELKPEEILRIFKDHGMRSRLKKLKNKDELLKYPTPSVIIAQNGAYHVLIGKKNGDFFVFDCVEKKINKLAAEAFQSLWSGEAIIVYPRFTNTGLFLNIRWLFKEFYKHRPVFSAVILSSFFIQLFGLVTPLFIQVIIDKVLAHHALTTLEVVAGAFFLSLTLC